MNYQVSYTQAAQRDLDALCHYLSDVASPEVAATIALKIMSAVESLTTFPYRHQRHHLSDVDRHVLPVSTWRIWYSITDDTVIIDRILHQRRDTAAEISAAMY